MVALWAGFAYLTLGGRSRAHRYAGSGTETGGTRATADLDRFGNEVLLDDRTASPGVKFKDAELLGMPWIVVVGRGWADGTVELRNRFTGENREIAAADAADIIAAELAAS